MKTIYLSAMLAATACIATEPNDPTSAEESEVVRKAPPIQTTHGEATDYSDPGCMFFNPAFQTQAQLACQQNLNGLADVCEHDGNNDVFTVLDNCTTVNTYEVACPQGPNGPWVPCGCQYYVSGTGTCSS